MAPKSSVAVKPRKDGGDRDQAMEMPENRGILWGKSPEECSKQNIDLFQADVDPSLLFGDLHGAALLDQVYAFYGDGIYDVPWFTKGGSRTGS